MGVAYRVKIRTPRDLYGVLRDLKRQTFRTLAKFCRKFLQRQSVKLPYGQRDPEFPGHQIDRRNRRGIGSGTVILKETGELTGHYG